MLEEFLQWSTCNFSYLVDLLTKLLQQCLYQPFIELWLISFEISLKFIILTFSYYSCYLSQGIHSLFSNPWTHISSSVNLVIIHALVKSCNHIIQNASVYVLKPIGSNSIDETLDSHFSCLCIISLLTLWNTVLYYSIEYIWCNVLTV